MSGNHSGGVDCNAEGAVGVCRHFRLGGPVVRRGDLNTRPPWARIGTRVVEFGLQCGMPLHVEAVYENGVLRPLQPLDLTEQEHVIVSVVKAASVSTG